MMNNEILSSRLRVRLRNDARNRAVSGMINDTFAAEIDNGYLTGYQMLHGTNSTVGGFNITGNAAATVDSSTCCTTVEYHLTYTWNDIIDPEPDTYPGDAVLSWIFHRLYDPQDYVIHISWTQNAKVEVCNDRIQSFEGYPFE